MTEPLTAAPKAAKPMAAAKTNAPLRNLVEQIEALENDKADIMSQIKDVYAEAKDAGFMVKVVRHVVRRRKREQHEIHQEDDLLATYEEMLG